MTVRAKSTDPRAVRARERIKAASFALASEKPVDEITVAEILARAEVSRQGFYRHFKDRDDAVLAGVRDTLGPLLAAGPIPEGLDPATPRSVYLLAAFLFEHRAAFENLVHSRASGRVFDAMRDVLREPCREFATHVLEHRPGPDGSATGRPDAGPRYDEADLERLTTFVVGGAVESLRAWMAGTSGDAPVEPAVWADQLWGIALRDLAPR